MSDEEYLQELQVEIYEAKRHRKRYDNPHKVTEDQILPSMPGDGH